MAGTGASAPSLSRKRPRFGIFSTLPGRSLSVSVVPFFPPWFTVNCVG